MKVPARRMIGIRNDHTRTRSAPFVMKGFSGFSATGPSFHEPVPTCRDRAAVKRPLWHPHICAGHCPECADRGEGAEVPRNVVTDRSDIRRAESVQIRQQ